MPLTPALLVKFHQEKEELFHPKAPKPQQPSPYAHLTGVLADKFAHEKTPFSKYTFKNVADVINNKGFPGWYDPSYMPMPDYFTKNHLDPLFNPIPEEGHSYGIMTIANMIHMHTLGMSFRLAMDEDVDKVVVITEAYLDYISVERNNRTVVNYAKQVKSFLQEAKKTQQRTHIRTGKVLSGSTDIHNILKELLGAL